MAPEVAGRNRVSRLKTVVLPAPLGPIRAWMVPRRTRRSMPSTATKPWNSFRSPRVSRIISRDHNAHPARRMPLAKGARRRSVSEGDGEVPALEGGGLAVADRLGLVAEPAQDGVGQRLLRAFVEEPDGEG